MARGSAGESVLHKHLRVLDAFDALHPFRTLTEIADAAGLAISTAHRLVRELEREGLLERAPDRTYRLGVRLWEYASRTPGALGLRELARPWLGAVHSRVRQHAQLGVLSGRDVLFIERMSTRDAVVNATLIGGRIPLPVSSSGLVLLAHADPALVDEVVSAGWPRHTAHTIRDGRELRERLRHVRADGFAVASGHIYEESRGIAVPVMGPHGVVYAAMGVVVANDDAPIQPIVELLATAAAGITRDLERAYLPDGGPTEGRIRPLVSTSLRSLEYVLEHGVDGSGAPRGG
ncbi:IclR family transcriptional regulator [Microbacterium immunditiarum]|uniref:DNA-binding IclR family transcriptional regulator n=1 Tax=Microbacterium immunditiarum TaxID=337480 RepID=A0A7Y9KMU6_9MICO|nr:IclR family transcriptional regulator [Microbacterium immunditiarum]NYE21129.1 DNA-binding IclR family transcriptional regulator [Microbacterium immunditiarum]